MRLLDKRNKTAEQTKRDYCVSEASRLARFKDIEYEVKGDRF